MVSLPSPPVVVVPKATRAELLSELAFFEFANGGLRDTKQGKGKFDAQIEALKAELATVL
jgi:hypothetical protein